MILLLKVAPACSVNMLSGVPKNDKAVVCITEKIHVLDKLCSDTGYSAVGYGLDVNKSTRVHSEKGRGNLSICM